MPEHFTALSPACTGSEVRAAVENSAAAAAAKVAAVTVFFMVMMASYRAGPVFFELWIRNIVAPACVRQLVQAGHEVIRRQNTVGCGNAKKI
ncbi:hypothetical protein CLAM6_03100 [Cobetia sp. AM6]|nr:hypothetical protein CLAM6_03100 [Cobetia sp. AM6]